MYCKGDAAALIEKLYVPAKKFYDSNGMAEYFRAKRKEHKYICIFGAGVWGNTLCRWLSRQGIQVDYFCDNDQNKRELLPLGIPFIAFERLKEKKDETYVIVSVSNRGGGKLYNLEINAQLKEFPHVMPNLQKFSGFYTNDYALSVDECAKCAEKIMGALEDESSRELFMNMIPFKFTQDAEPLREQPLEKFYVSSQYFSREFYQHRPDAVVVDCGAYKGDTLLEFIRLFGKEFLRYHCFEMDAAAFAELQRNASALPYEIGQKVVLHQQGVHSSSGEMSYDSLTETLASSIVGTNGKLKANVVTLDEAIYGEPVTMINMDIEGSELPALIGARKLIAKYHPILAISIYHSTEQFFSVPAYIIDNFPFYRFYLGLHSTITDDCVFYAIPITGESGDMD